MKGVLLFAFNNDIDYFAQAVWCANRVNQYLDIPVTIVTDPRSRDDRDCKHDIIYTDAESGGSRVYSPGQNNKKSIWYNAARYRCYELTPYTETIVIDTDYIVSSNQLNLLFESASPVSVCRNVFDPTGRNGYSPYQFISRNTLHHWWATIMYFRRDPETETFFDYYRMIRENYQHYANLYNFRTQPYRNDYAVSIALETMWGHVLGQAPAIPWSMCNVSSDVDIEQLDHNSFNLIYEVKDPKPRRQKVELTGIDFHFMNKLALGKLYESN